MITEEKGWKKWWMPFFSFLCRRMFQTHTIAYMGGLISMKLKGGGLTWSGENLSMITLFISKQQRRKAYKIDYLRVHLKWHNPKKDWKSCKVYKQKKINKRSLVAAATIKTRLIMFFLLPYYYQLYWKFSRFFPYYYQVDYGLFKKIFRKWIFRWTMAYLMGLLGLCLLSCGTLFHLAYDFPFI